MRLSNYESVVYIRVLPIAILQTIFAWAAFVELLSMEK